MTDLRRGLLGLALALLTLGVYAPTLSYGFVELDDSLYVTGNRHVQGGLSWEGFDWAWRARVASNWHPLTLLSHMLDWELWGGDAFGHHLGNLLLHLANVGLVFAVLRRMTGADGESAAVAALFAVHPAHVESVAWISERKDVLAAFFFLLALAAWLGYVRRPAALRYLLVVLAFAAALLAKPMAVTFPCVLLLLDYWPLRRLVSAESPRRERWRLAVEKLPLFAMAAVASAVTVVAQRSALGSLEAVPLPLRGANALVSYVVYLGKILWPRHLAVFYPLPPSVAAWKAALAGALLSALTALAVLARRRSPWLLIGWLWFVGMLVPVIGLVQVGRQAMADRYTYLPSLGIFLALAWEVPARLRGWKWRPRLRTAAAVVALAGLLLLAGVARAQVETWRDSLTLFRHALAVTEGNYLAAFKVASLLTRLDRREEAERYYREALRMGPGMLATVETYGRSLVRWGRPAEAVPLLRRATELQPKSAGLHAELGDVLAELGEVAQARVELRRALELDPRLAAARRSLRDLEDGGERSPTGGRGQAPPLRPSD